MIEGPTHTLQIIFGNLLSVLKLGVDLSSLLHMIEGPTHTLQIIFGNLLSVLKLQTLYSILFA